VTTVGAMRLQHAGCKREAVVVVEATATLAVRATLPLSLTGSAYSCRPHVGVIAKQLAGRVLDLEEPR
jgi:hypothetical protein